MEHAQIVSEIRDELVAFTQGRFEIDESTDLVAELNMDSLQVMNLLLQIEDRFDISVPVSILPDVRTLGELATEIGKLLPRE